MEIRGVTKSLVEYLRGEIITRQLAPGQKLNEIQLSSRLGVSRPPLREAFRILEHDHLVVSIPRRGTYVTPTSPEDLQDVYEAREMIECYAIDLLETKNITDLPQVASALAKASRLSIPSHVDSHEMLLYRETFADYHIKLVESAGNSRISHFNEAISSSLARYEYMHFSMPEAARRSLEEHQQILNLIRTADYHQAKECLRGHLAYTTQFPKGILTEG